MARKAKITTESEPPKPRNLKGLIARALREFQKYRVIQCCLKTTGTVDECICFTSGARVPRTKDLHGGHFIPVEEGMKTNYNVAFELINVHAQTKYQNRTLHGNRAVYRVKMIEVYGLKRVEELEALARKPKRLWDFTFEELDNNIAYWRKEIKRMLAEKKL
jgi:hypothetical protein